VPEISDYATCRVLVRVTVAGLKAREFWQLL
jgi:hypothetical protein